MIPFLHSSLPISAPDIASGLSGVPVLSSISGNISDRVSFTLLHFLWQGLAVALLLHLLLVIFKPQKSTTRYALCCMAMFLMLLSPVLTYALLPESTNFRSANVSDSKTNSIPNEFQLCIQSKPLEITNRTEANRISTSPWENLKSSLKYFLKPLNGDGTVHLFNRAYSKYIHPFIPFFWVTGMTILGFRFLLSLISVHWLSKSKAALPDHWNKRAESICQKLKLRTAPKIYSCGNTKTAMVAGLFKPVVLIPSSWLLKMPADSLEAIIVHELSHIKRGDILINFLQRFMETVLFYHPAIWWLSRKIHMEQEMCCDEMAVNITGKRIVYAETLRKVAWLFKDKSSNSLCTVSFVENNSFLLTRINNLFDTPKETGTKFWNTAILLALISLFNFGIRTVESDYSLSGLIKSEPHTLPVISPHENLADYFKIPKEQFSFQSYIKKSNDKKIVNSLLLCISEDEINGSINPEQITHNTTESEIPNQLPATSNISPSKSSNKLKKQPELKIKLKLMAIPFKDLDWEHAGYKNHSFLIFPIHQKHPVSSSRRVSFLKKSKRSISEILYPDLVNRIFKSNHISILDESTMKVPDFSINESPIEKENLTTWFLTYLHGTRLLFQFEMHQSEKNPKFYQLKTKFLKGKNSSAKTTNTLINRKQGVLQLFPIPERELAIAIYTYPEENVNLSGNIH